MDPFEISKMSKENKQRLAGAGVGAAAVGVPLAARGSIGGTRQVIRGVRQEFKAGRKLAEGAADVAAANGTATRIQAAGRAPNPRELFVDIPQALQRAKRGNRKASEAEATSRAAWENIRRGGKRVKQGIPREIGGSAVGAAAGGGGVAAYQKADERKAITKADPFEISKSSVSMAGHRVAQIGSYGVRSVPKAAPGAKGAVGRRVAEQQRRMESVNQYSTTAVPKAPTQARMNEARQAAKPPSNFSWGRLAAYGGGGAAVVGAPVAAYGVSRKKEGMAKRANPFEVSKRASTKWAARAASMTGKDSSALNYVASRREAASMGEAMRRRGKTDPVTLAHATMARHIAPVAGRRPSNISYGNQSALRRGTNNRYTRLPE